MVTVRLHRTLAEGTGSLAGPVVSRRASTGDRAYMSYKVGVVSVVIITKLPGVDPVQLHQILSICLGCWSYYSS